jgi:hypothetical protein
VHVSSRDHLWHVEVAVVAQALDAVQRQALVKREAHFDGVAPLEAGPPEARHHVSQAADLGSRKREGGGKMHMVLGRMGELISPPAVQTLNICPVAMTSILVLCRARQAVDTMQWVLGV